MSKIELYDSTELTGACVLVDADCPDLTSYGFLNRTQSLKVHGDQPWILFSDTNYSGEFKVYKEGSYRKIPTFSNTVSSLRVIPGGLQQPSIIVHERTNLEGVQRIITNITPTLDSQGMNGVLSHRVQKGVWSLYDGENYQGNSIISIAGDKVVDETLAGLSNRVRSLRPSMIYETPN